MVSSAIATQGSYPFVSWKDLQALRTLAMVLAWYSWVPWEKFMRAMFMPMSGGENVTILHFIKMKVYIDIFSLESCMPRGKTFLGINIIEIIVNVTNVIYHNTICSGR